MEYSLLGRTELRCSRLGLGCSHFGSLSVPKSDRELISLVHQALDLGIVAFDTADSYGQGSSERILGKALGGEKQSTVVMTKAGYCFSTAVRIGAQIKGPLRKLAGMVRPLARALRKGVQKARSGQISQRFDEDYLLSAVDASLVRLNRETIDLFLLHSPPGDVLQGKIFVPALERMRDAGKIRYFGASCDSTRDALLALEIPGISAIQVSLTAEPRAEVERVLERCQALGVGVIGRNVLHGGGLAAGGGGHEAVLEEAFRSVMDRRVTVNLVGTTNAEHLRRNAAAFAYAAGIEVA